MADFGPDSFLGSLQGGGARQNLFTVTLNSPYGDSDDITFRCKAASLPAQTIGIIEAPYMGQVVKLPGNSTYEEWNITVLVDEGLNSRRTFEDWMEAINSREFNVTVDNNSKNHMVDGIITQYNKDGSVGGEYSIKGCWPTTMGAVEMSWEAATAVMEFQVTMALQYWTRSV